MFVINANENKEKFKFLCHKYIHRPGLDDLLDWLETTDFYEAPASTRFHLMQEGGLCQHSINVFDQLCQEYHSEGLIPLDEEEDSATLEELAIVALFHDICKVNFYQISFRNVKNEFGIWEKVPYYTIENQGLLVGHGYKSARLVSKYMNITDKEYMAITHHMGIETDWNIREVSECFSKNKLALLLHIADTKAAYIIENENNE